MPTGAITHVLIGLTNPVYARYQTNRERLTLVFGKMLRLIVRTTALLAMIFLLEAERLIPLISGPEWIRSVELLRWMVIYALFRPFLDDIQALLLAVGVPETIAKINGIVTGATVVGIPLLVYAWGLKGIAIGAGSAAALGAGLSFYWVRHYVDIAWMQAFFKPALSVGASLGAMALLDGIIPGDGWTALVFRLAIEILLYGVLLVVLEGRELYEEVVDLRRILGQKEDEAQV